ncbi:MAG: helix-turn-helix transcriptional regulator [Bacteroidota bacterium]|nr:helix-turn-helix transcriptional regulator [Bacteroidota bacterium]MDP3558382.1 helix-turn-helix transcriptional regulator [Bacteroidota bacterium]
MTRLEKASFGEYIRLLRKNMRLPLRKVASQLNIDQSTLGKIERNDRKPTNELIEKLAVIFGTDVKELKVKFLSDRISYELFDEGFGDEVLRLAEQKIKMLRSKR